MSAWWLAAVPVALGVAMLTDERWNWSGRASCWWHGRHMPVRYGWRTVCTCCHRVLPTRGGVEVRR